MSCLEATEENSVLLKSERKINNHLKALAGSQIRHFYMVASQSSISNFILAWLKYYLPGQIFLFAELKFLILNTVFEHGCQDVSMRDEDEKRLPSGVVSSV